MKSNTLEGNIWGAGNIVSLYGCWLHRVYVQFMKIHSASYLQYVQFSVCVLCFNRVLKIGLLPQPTAINNAIAYWWKTRK